jgi:hypothetical protein
MTKTARDEAKQIKRLRDEGKTWAEVTEQVGLSETTARKRLAELEADLASSNGRAAKVEPPKAATPPAPPTRDAVTQRALDGLAASAAASAASTDAKPRSGRYLKLQCRCEDAKVIRCSRSVATRGVACPECKELFEEAAA